jgi:hypothetical protein
MSKSLDRAIFDAPNLRTSRRNFIAGASTLGVTLVGLALASKVANAQELPGCEPSTEQPNKCNCFLAGTRIATHNDEVEIERLRIGDFVLSASGQLKPIKWIGRRRFTRAAEETWSPDVAPVKIARFALDHRSPHADLYVTGGHALYLYGLLIPAKDLINGRSITSNPHANGLTLDYYHIELEAHDAILAEGLPAETYAGNDRLAFDNAEEYERLYGAPTAIERSFAPIASLNGGRQELMSRLRSVVSPIYDVRKPLDVIRDQIASRAELKMAA